jgi:hypothetical protein
MRFGAKEHDDPTAGTWVEEFEFCVQGATGVRTLKFNARLGKIPTGGLLSAMTAAERGDAAGAAKAYQLSIAKMVDDRDGLPARWTPVPLPRQEGDDRPEVFRVPWGDAQGELRPMSESDKYLRETPHSSRRRWLSLLEDDEDAMVEFGDLQALFEWMVSTSTGNRSAASS